MPDTGSFEAGMPERTSGNPGWGEAFAALPQETPHADAWRCLQARLPARATAARTRWPLWLAAAASLALVALIPLRMLPRTTAEPAASAPQVSATASPVAVVAPPASAAPVSASPAQPVSTPVATRDATPRARRTAPSQRPIRTAAAPADATRIAASEAPTRTDLEPLYAQSAQLESLLALARDERVASGTSAALSDALDNRLATIDATLIQPGLSDAQRSELWNQRVDALQQLVGIETTNRLYAARGQRYDAALVSID